MNKFLLQKNNRKSLRPIVWKLKDMFYFGLSALFYIITMMICLFPAVWSLISSLKPNEMQFIVEFWPKEITCENYLVVLQDHSFIKAIYNSLIVAGSATVISSVMALLAAYPLSRKKFIARQTLIMMFLSIMSIPHIALLSGLFSIINSLGLYNNKCSLVLSYTVFLVPFLVWMLTNFMKAIPKEIEEAAMLDGANDFIMLRKILIPLMLPSLVTTSVVAFIMAWNEFLFALTFTLTNKARTVPVVIALFSGNSQYELPFGTIMAASMSVTIPILILVIVFHNRIINGFIRSGTKS